MNLERSKMVASVKSYFSGKFFYNRQKSVFLHFYATTLQRYNIFGVSSNSYLEIMYSADAYMLYEPERDHFASNFFLPSGRRV